MREKAYNGNKIAEILTTARCAPTHNIAQPQIVAAAGKCTVDTAEKRGGSSTMIDEILQYNKGFVAEEKWREYVADKYPQRKLAVLSCMDTRLTKLLPAALGFKNGDVTLIKNAGGVVSHPYGSGVRSLLVSIFELGVTEVMVIGHTDCGVQHIDVNEMIAQMAQRGIPHETIDILKYSGVDFDKWLGGFDTVEQSVADTVNMLRQHPLIPKDVMIRGFVMNVVTGELKCI